MSHPPQAAHHHTLRSLPRRLLALACAATLFALGLAVVSVTGTAAPASADTGDFSCGDSLLYGVGLVQSSTKRTMYSVDTVTGATTALGTFTSASSNASMNGLAVTKDGSAAYAVVDYSNGSTEVSTSTTVHRYSMATNTSTQVATITGLTVNGLKAGGIDPTTNTYWIGGQGSGSLSGYFLVYSINLTTMTNNGLQFKTPITAAMNSDLAFDAKGNLYMTLSAGTASTNRLMEFGADEISASGAVVAGTQLATLSPTDQTFPAMAFGADGYLYTEASGVLYRTNPSSGAVVSTTTSSPNVTLSDMGSCATPNTLTVQVKVASKVTSSDQFLTTIDATNGLSSISTGTTSGTNLGLHNSSAEIAGPVLVFQRKTYTFSTVRADGRGTTGYTAAYACTDAAGDTLSSGASNAGSVTIPTAAGTGVNVTCTVTVRVGAPHLNLTMTTASTPTKAGDPITYTYAVTSNGNELLSGIKILDPLVSSTAFTCAAGSADIDVTITCTGTHNATQAEVDAGTVTNTATATGAGWLSQTGTSDSATVTTTIAPAPGLSVALSPTVNSWTTGGTIVWTATATNTGNVTLSSLSTSDLLGGTWSCQASSLAPGASTACTWTYTLVRAVTVAGSLADTVTSTAKTPKNASVQATGSATAKVPNYGVPQASSGPTDCSSCHYY